MAFTASHIAFFLLVALMFIQIPLVAADRSNINIYHALIILYTPLGIAGLGRVRSKAVAFFLVVLTATTVVAGARYGLGMRTTLLPFLLVAYLLGEYFGRRIDERKFFMTLGLTLACVAAFLLVRNIVYFQYLSVLYTRSGYVQDMLYLATGGRNIEATIVAFLSMLLIGRPGFKYAILLSLLTSGMMQSRAGLIATTLSLLAATARNMGSRNIYGRLVVVLLGVVLAGLFLSLGNVSIPLLDRFELGSEMDLADQNLGRLALWAQSLAAIRGYPFGFGPGNGVPVIENLSGLSFVENNVHNIYLQFLLEGGIQTLAAFLLVAWVTIRTRAVTEAGKNMKVLLIAYFILGNIQFTGYEVYFWFFLGFFFSSQREQERRDALARRNAAEEGAAAPA